MPDTDRDNTTDHLEAAAFGSLGLILLWPKSVRGIRGQNEAGHEWRDKVRPSFPIRRPRRFSGAGPRGSPFEGAVEAVLQGCSGICCQAFMARGAAGPFVALPTAAAIAVLLVATVLAIHNRGDCPFRAAKAVSTAEANAHRRTNGLGIAPRFRPDGVASRT